MKESKELELKSTITNTFLKTVSAFSNYNSGKIIFGIDDNGKIIGLENIEELCLDLENKINDNISPKPDFRFIKDTKKNVITLIVEEGFNKPYLYKGKAYKRNDTSTVEVDKIELKILFDEEEMAKTLKLFKFKDQRGLLEYTSEQAKEIEHMVPKSAIRTSQEDLFGVALILITENKLRNMKI